jgi:cytochrome P450
VAVADTFGAAFPFVLYDLSTHPAAQIRLRAELRSIANPLITPEHKVGIREDEALPSPYALEQLPFLWAIIKESIRLRNTIPTPNPRATPAGTMTSLGPYKNIPPGVRVTALAWSLNRNEDIFHDPERWLPERWLDRSPEELAAMERSYWAFGSGSRQCLGRNVAMEIMRYVLASIYTSFETSIVDSSRFVKGSVGEELMLEFKKVV